jgi:hypothetical protein
MYTFHCARGPLHCDDCLKERHAGKKYCLLKLYLEKDKISRPIIEFDHKFYEFEIERIFSSMEEALQYADKKEIQLYLQ